MSSFSRKAYRGGSDAKKPFATSALLVNFQQFVVCEATLDLLTSDNRNRGQRQWGFIGRDCIKVSQRFLTECNDELGMII